MSRKQKTPIGLVALSSDPASGSDGDMYFNTGSNAIKIYYSGAWNALTGGGGGGGSGDASFVDFLLMGG